MYGPTEILLRTLITCLVIYFFCTLEYFFVVVREEDYNKVISSLVSIIDGDSTSFDIKKLLPAVLFSVITPPHRCTIYNSFGTI